MVNITAAAQHHQIDNAQQREKVRQAVQVGLFKRHRHVRRRGHDNHQVRRNPVRPLGALDLPVGEVTEFDHHRHTDLIDAEAERLVLQIDIGHSDRSQRYRINGLAWPHHIDMAQGSIGLVLAHIERRIKIDSLPVRWTIVGRNRRPVLSMLKPAHPHFEVPFARVAWAAVDNNRLNCETLDQIAMGHGINSPRACAINQRQVGVAVGLGDRCLGEHHQVVHSKGLQIRDAFACIGVVVPKLANRLRPFAAHRCRRDEVIRSSA